jgi:glutamate carboxypeptidase
LCKVPKMKAIRKALAIWVDPFCPFLITSQSVIQSNTERVSHGVAPEKITGHHHCMTRLNADETHLLDAIGSRQSLLVEELFSWSAINSGSSNLEGLAQMARVLADRVATMGCTPALIASDPVESIDSCGETVSLKRGDHLHAALRPDAPRQILLAGHMDTVFPAAHAFQTPRWRDGESLNGPGVADMKGGLLVMMTAVEALNASPWASQLGVQIVINSDEEVSSLGSAALLTRSAMKADAALLFEPAMADGTLAGARKGIATFAAVAKGRPAHAGRNPQEGRNAVLAIADLMLRASALPSQLPGLTVNVARVDGGGPTNVVPDLAIGRFELRVPDHDLAHAAEAALRTLAEDVSAAHDLTISLNGRFHRPPKPMDATQLALFEAVKACGNELALPVSWVPTGGCCDGNNIAATGIAVVDTLGVRGGAIHSTDEYMYVESLAERAKLTALLLMRIAQGRINVPARQMRP